MLMNKSVCNVDIIYNNICMCCDYDTHSDHLYSIYDKCESHPNPRDTIKYDSNIKLDRNGSCHSLFLSDKWCIEAAIAMFCTNHCCVNMHVSFVITLLEVYDNQSGNENI